MVNFYNEYVTCSDTATLADVAGEVGARVGMGGASVSPSTLLTPAHPYPQTTWTT